MVSASLTREQQESRLWALYQASLDLVQDISIDTLLERIAKISCEQVNTRYGAVGLLDAEGKLERFIPIGLTPEQIKKIGHLPRGLGLLRAVMDATEPIRIEDLSNDPRLYGFPAHHPDMKNFLGVPIRQGDRLLGMIYLTDKLDGSGFSDYDQQVIEMVASFAAVAIANARLYKDLMQRDHVLTRRNENLALMNQLASTLATSTDIDPILNKALDHLMDYLHLEVGEVYLRQEERKQLNKVIHRGSALKNIWKKDNYVIGESVIGAVAKSGEPVLIQPDDPETEDLDDAVRAAGIRQVACLPLSGRRGMIGVLCMATNHIDPLDELEVQYLQAISSWVGTAIENVRLNMQGKRLAILEERERIGMDLHDGIIQSIYAVGLTLEHARLLMDEDPAQAQQRTEQAIQDLNSTIRDIRAYILDLRPRHLHDESLMEGIQRLVHEFRANTLLEVYLQGPRDDLRELSDEKAKALFHICQEALANIAKHARAKQVEVVAWTTEERVLLEIHDDGRGFDPQAVKMSIGHGLLNMRTRARSVNGDVEFSSEAGNGTVVMAWVPYND